MDAEPDARGSDLDDDDLVLRVRDFVRRARAHASDWMDEAKQAFAFRDGDQWSAEDRAILDEDGRPAITFNRVAPIADAVAGSEVNNRQETRFLPRAMEDTGAADVATNLVRWARQQCEAEDEESHAFADATVCGMGWTETRMDYGDSSEGRIVVERFDPGEALWDPAAVRKNLLDGKEVARARKWRLDAAMAEWPDKRDELETATAGLDDDGTNITVVDPRTRYRQASEARHGDRSRMIEVVHYQWCEDRPVVVYAEGGKRMDMPAAEWAKAVKRYEEVGAPVPDHVRQKRRVWQHAFVAGDTVLERGDCPFPKGPTLRCMTAKMDRNTGLFYGIVRAMIDPQKWANKWLAQTLHILNTSAKSGIIAEEDAIDDWREAERTYATPGGITKLAVGGLNKFKEKQPGSMPAGFANMMQFAIQAVPDTTGINKELLGLSDRDQAGVLEAQRKQAAQAILAPLFDGRRRYHKGHGEMMLYFVRTYIPRETQIRVMGDDGDMKFLNAALLPDAVEFDVVVDESPTSPNQKTEVWQLLTPMLPAMMKMGVPAEVFMELLAFSPLPASSVARIKAAMKEPQGGEPKPDPAMLKAQADIEATKMRAENDIQIKQATAQADVQIAGAKAQGEMQIKAQKAETDRQLALQRDQDRAAQAWAKVLPGSPFAN